MARRLRGLVALTALALAGCSWGAEEPGLFRTPAPTLAPVPTAPGTSAAPQPTNPALPVAGDVTWSTGDGTGVTVRFAVHAVRRTETATVLDWSVTPLAVPGRPPGQALPAGVDLGLGRAVAGEQAIALLDVAGGRAYRPLANISPAQFSRCLCTPLFAVLPTLRSGDTRLLQLTFPLLPDAVTHVDVQLPNVAPVVHVPVTPAGSAPTARRAVDLTRPDDASVAASRRATLVADDRARSREVVSIHRVVSAPGLTAVEWSVHAVDVQTGYAALGQGPPLADPLPDGVRVVNRAPASGPRAVATGSAGPVVGARWTTGEFAGLPAYECVCSELGLWAKGLSQAGGTVSLETTLPALPAGTVQADITFPGLPALRAVPVTPAADGSRWLGPPQAVDAGTWRYAVNDPPVGWSTAEWPTPLPALDQVGDYQSRTERLLDSLPAR